MNEKMQAAVQTLRKSAAKGKTKKAHLENIENISSATVLLNFSRPSSQVFSKLSSLLRAPFIPLYASYAATALKTASAILEVLLMEKLQPYTSEGTTLEKGLKEGWEKAVYSLISGVLDYLESGVTETEKTAIASSFYAPLCNFFFEEKTVGCDQIDAMLKSSAFLLLSESSASHPANQAKLRSLKVLGGRKLGCAISQTKEYVVLESLLNLFARLLPSASTSEGKHTSFVKEVFGNTFANTDVPRVIQDVLGRASVKDWEETSAKLFDIFSSADISFPQPFEVQEVVVCGNTYPQPNVSDRFYIDKSAFFVNVEQEDGLYESLQIHFSTVQYIKMVPKTGKSIGLTVTLTSVPMLAEQSILPIATGADSLELFVEIQKNDGERFIKALHHRDLGHTLSESSTSKKTTFPQKSRVSVTEASALLEFRADGKEWTEDPLLATAVKAKEVEDFYSVSSKTMLGESATDKIIDKENSAGSDQHVSSELVLAETVHSSPNADMVNVPEDTHADQNSKSDGTDGKPKGNRGTGNCLSSSPTTQLQISVFGEEDEVLSSTNNRGQEVVDQIPQTIDDATIERNSRTEVAPGRQIKDTFPKAKKTARRRIDSDEESEIVEPNTRSKKTTRVLRSSNSPRLASPAKKVNEAGSEKKTKSCRRGNPRAAKKIPQDVTLPQDISSKRSNNVLDEGNNGQIIDNDDQRAHNIFLKANSTPLAIIGEKAVDTTSIHPGRGSVIVFNEDTTQEDVKSLPLISKKKSEHAAFEPSLHSSPLSRVSGMKGKYGGRANRQEKTNTRKRVAEETIPVECPPSPKRKKPCFIVPERTGGQLERKFRTQGKTAKENTEDIDWEQIPSSDARVALHPSSPTSFKLASKKAALRNGDKSSTKTSEKARAGKKTQAVKPGENCKREPLQEKNTNVLKESRFFDMQEVSGIQSKVSKNPPQEAGVYAKETKPKPAYIGHKDNAIPSLEDVLLRGAALFATHPENATQEDGEGQDDASDGELQTDLYCKESECVPKTELPSLGNVPVEADILVNSRPPSPVNDEMVELQILADGPPVEVKRTKVAQSVKNDFIDLTEEVAANEIQDASRIPPSTKETLKRKNQMVAINPATPTYDRASNLLPAEILGASHPGSAKVKVKFDEKPRYVSVSFEELVHHAEGTEDRYHGASVRKRGGLTNNRIRTENALAQKDFDGNKCKEPGMSEIISVINSIQDVIISNIANKSRAVRSDVRIARDRLLHEAMADLQDMRAESIEHYNGLISLETEYANASRKLVNSYEVVEQVNQEICTFVQQSIKIHDRKTLSKNLPQSLFAAGLPSLFKKLSG